MVPDIVPLYAVVIVLFSLIYFSLASISFLLVRLDVPEVATIISRPIQCLLLDG